MPQKTIFKTYINTLTTKYVKFNGRSARREFWIFKLTNYFIFLSLYILHRVFSTFIYLFTNSDKIIISAELHDLIFFFTQDNTNYYSLIKIFNIFYLFLVLAIFIFLFIPTVAATFRRLQDINLSGWFYFLNIIPFLGYFLIFILNLIGSQKHKNKYGENPYNIQEL